MKLHRRAKLGLGGRHELVKRIDAGLTQKAAAAAALLGIALHEQHLGAAGTVAQKDQRNRFAASATSPSLSPSPGPRPRRASRPSVATTL